MYLAVPALVMLVKHLHCWDKSAQLVFIKHLVRRLSQARGQLPDQAADLGVQDDAQGGALLGGRCAPLPQHRRVAVAPSLPRSKDLSRRRAHYPLTGLRTMTFNQVGALRASGPNE